MKPLAPTFAVTLFLAATSAAEGDTVYRCLQDGKPIFTDAPGPGCQPLNLQVVRPSPEEVARLEEKKRQEEAQAREEQARIDRERVIRAQEEAARAAEIQAQAQRRLAEQREREAEQPRYFQPNPPYYYYPGGVVTGGYPAYPRPPLLPNPPIANPPQAPGYPYAPDRATVGGGGRR